MGVAVIGFECLLSQRRRRSSAYRVRLDQYVVGHVDIGAGRKLFFRRFSRWILEYDVQRDEHPDRTRVNHACARDDDQRFECICAND